MHSSTRANRSNGRPSPNRLGLKPPPHKEKPCPLLLSLMPEKFWIPAETRPSKLTSFSTTEPWRRRLFPPVHRLVLSKHTNSATETRRVTAARVCSALSRRSSKFSVRQSKGSMHPSSELLTLPSSKQTARRTSRSSAPTQSSVCHSPSPKRQHCRQTSRCSDTSADPTLTFSPFR
ncbi:unannotated protein [freshwater metagenome]|uniref:Unannotated protein n=1 Tax=freshwater metagenome TaxID=449393 RepID=A0A6J6GCL5_9ZZZZ